MKTALIQMRTVLDKAQNVADAVAQIAAAAGQGADLAVFPEIFCCPYDIHELVTEKELSQILLELNEEHKELLFLCAVRLFSSTRIARIRGQSDRNIRKVRGTMLKKIRKKLLAALTDKAEKQQPMTLLEKEFLRECGLTVDNGTKKQYNR